jgi:hypothetical protein
MIEFMIAEILLKAAALSAILWLVARHEADFGFGKAAMVVAVMGLGSFFNTHLLAPKFGSWAMPVGLAVDLILVIVMIRAFCWVSPGKALLSAALFMGVNVCIALGIAALVARINEPAQGFMEKRAQRDARIAGEIMETIEQAYPSGGGLPPAPLPPPQDTPRSARTPRAGSPDSQPWARARKQLNITRIVVDKSGTHWVSIDGNMKRKGDTASTDYAGWTYRWTITLLTDKSIKLAPLDRRPTQQ